MVLAVERVDTIARAVRETGSLEEAGRLWSTWIVKAGRVARALPAGAMVKYLQGRGFKMSRNALRKASAKGRFWSTKRRLAGHRKEARVYDPKELIVYCEHIRDDPNYYRPNGRRL